MRGENDLYKAGDLIGEATNGTSPRARGKHGLIWWIMVVLRNIPACAGKTFDPIASERPGQEHPRVRGENSFYSGHKSKSDVLVVVFVVWVLVLGWLGCFT